jgi:hypothetical protein
MIFYYLTLSVCFFPFISFNIIDGDTQIYSYILCLMLFLLNLKNSFKFSVLFIPILGCFLSFLISENSLVTDYVRSFIIYSSPLIYITASFVIFSVLLKEKRNMLHFNEFFLKFLFLITILFGFVGVIQAFYDRDLFSILLTSRTSSERGVTSLTPEPSMYGLTLLLLGFLVFLTKYPSKLKKITTLLIILQIIFLSQSTLVILTLMLILTTYLLLFNKKFFLLSFFLLFPMIVFILVSLAQIDENLRIINLLLKITDSPYDILYSDGSLSERFYHVFLSFGSYGFPRGITSFYSEILKAQNIYDSFWWGEPTNKIMSGVGGAFWETGIFCLPIIFFPLLNERKSFSVLITKKRIFITVSLILICIHSITYSMPLISIVLSYFYFINLQKAKKISKLHYEY